MANHVEYIGFVSNAVKMRRAIWNVACFLFFRPFITSIFSKWRVMVLRFFGADVSYDAHVYSSVKIWAPWNLKMEKGACLGPDVVCYNQAMVTLKRESIVSQYGYICTAGHEKDKRNTSDTGLIVAPVTIGEGAWIGTRAFIGMGVEVGEYAIVGATASVFKDVEAWTIVGGNPAKFIKEREIDEKI